MIQTILLTALSAQTTLLNPTLTTVPQKPQVVFTQVLPEENYVSYVVQNGDTLKSIARTYYGSEDQWATVQKDNPNIKDADNLVEGSLLNLRVVMDAKPQVLPAQDAQKEIATQLDEPTAGASATPTQTDTPIPTAIPTAVPTVEATATPAPTVVVTNTASSISDEAITYLGNCEAGMNPSRNSGNGYYGAFQFSYGTWKSMNTGYERADLAPIEVQEAAVKQLLQRSSIYNQFPACARKMHGAGLI